MKSKVIYRKFPEGDVIAFFPQIPYDYTGHYCSSYQHVGQHGSADCLTVTRATIPASPSEYAALHHELTSIGYDLTIATRVTPFDYAVRTAEARKARVTSHTTEPSTIASL